MPRPSRTMPRRNIGRGYWSKVARIKKGQVVKFFSEKVSKKEARLIRKAHSVFIRLLGEAGVTVPKTEMKEKELTGGKFKLRIFQEGFKDAEMGENYLRTASKQDAIKFAGQLVEETLKVTNFNRKEGIPHYGVVIGADFKPDNVAVRGGKIIFIDTFSPHIRKASDPKHINPAFERYFAKRGRALQWATKGYITGTVYDPKKRLVTLISAVARIRPELRLDFLKEARARVKADPSAEIRKELLPVLTSWQITKAKAIGGAISWLGKRKRMQIKIG